MVDLDEEFVRMEGLLARRERMALGVTCTEMIELITRLRQAEKDAERYGWLKGQPWFECEAEWNMSLYIKFDEYDFTAAAIDAAIDEAMK